ncbi:MAG: hypothetical protein ACRD0U_07115, partial [Acidimicrobiales bacterium]
MAPTRGGDRCPSTAVPVFPLHIEESMGADEQPPTGAAPTLFVHDRHRQVLSVGGDAAAAVVGWLTGGRNADGAALARVRDLAVWLHDRHWWLVCGCRPAASRPPLLVPVKRLGRCFFSRRPGTPHDGGCPLALAERGATERSPARRRAVRPWNGGWRLLGRLDDHSPASANGRDRAYRRSRDASPARIELVLLSALTRAGYTRLRPQDVICRPGHDAVHARNPYTAIRTLAPEVVAGDVRWSDIACTYLPSLAAHLDVLPSVGQRFRAGIRPLGVFLGIVDHIEAVRDRHHELVWRSAAHGTATARIDVAIHYSAPMAHGTPGPFWVLLLLGSPAESAGSKFAVVHACAQPVLSRRVLLPVNSAPERETAELLLRQVKYWARPASRLAIDVEVEKPVFDEATPSGGCRPDFTLWLPDSRRVIVQTA